MALLLEFGTLILAVILLIILWKLLEDPKQLAINSIVGILIFWLLNEFMGLGIPINWLTIVIVALAGVPGAILVILIHFLGLGF